MSNQLEEIGRLALARWRAKQAMNAACDRAADSGLHWTNPDYPSYDPERLEVLRTIEELGAACKLYEELGEK